MDKRTLTFALLVTLTFFGVNFFFQQKEQDNLREWNEQQQAKQAKKQILLEADIAEHTAKAGALPLVSLYADEEGKNFLTTGVQVEQSILTLSWNATLPQTIFSKKSNSTQKLETYQLSRAPAAIGDAALYQKGGTSPLTIGYLPDFGKFDLQLVSFSPEHADAPVAITLGYYTDGHFSRPIDKVEAHKLQIEGKKEEEKKTQK